MPTQPPIFTNEASSLLHLAGTLTDISAIIISIPMIIHYLRWSGAWRTAFGTPLWKSLLSGLKVELSGNGQQNPQRAALSSMFPITLGVGLFIAYPLTSALFFLLGGVDALHYKWEHLNAQFFSIQELLFVWGGDALSERTAIGAISRLTFLAALIHIPHIFTSWLWAKSKSPLTTLASIDPPSATLLSDAARDKRLLQAAISEMNEIDSAIEEELAGKNKIDDSIDGKPERRPLPKNDRNRL